MSKKLPDFFINAFYETKFKDNLFIVKASGRIIQDERALQNLMNNINALANRGIKIIMIYGFGNAMDIAANERNIKITKHESRRVTNLDTLDLMKQVVCGTMALKVGSAMARAQIDGINLNATPHNWLELSLWNAQEKGADFGYVGEINDVNARPISRMLGTYNVIAIPCIATMNDGQHCNMNADRLAMHLANSLQADKLIFLSNVDGVLDKDGKTIPVITDNDLQSLIDNKVVIDGMRIKMEQCFKALKGGVKRIHLINGLSDDALYKEIFESVGPGTMLFKEDEKDNYMNEVKIQKAIGGK